MFEVTAGHFYAAMQTFVKIRSLSLKPTFTWKRRQLPGNAHQVSIDFNKLEKKVKILCHDTSEELSSK